MSGPDGGGRAADAVAADVADLTAFVEAGESTAASLVEVFDRVAATRSSVLARLGTVDVPTARVAVLAGGAGADPLADLIDGVRATNGFVDGIAVSLGGGGGVDEGSSSGDGWLVDYRLLPAGDSDLVDYSMYLALRSNLALATTSQWMLRVGAQSFHPRNAQGRYVGRAGYSRWEWFRLARNDVHWNPRPNRAATAARWKGVGRWAGRAGTVIVFAWSGWSEWDELSHDPALSTGDRVGQTLTVATTTTAGSWAGAMVGAQAGAAIGTLICPGVGTVVGSFVGGFVGGVAGAELGSVVGDEIKGAVGDVVDGIADVGGDALDAVSFWD